MKAEWTRHCLRLSAAQADLYSGCRKIIRGRSLVFHKMDDTLQLSDAGYTKTKMRYLEKGYLHEESREAAVELWDRRKKQGKYGSIGFHCYNHYIKNDPTKKSKRASVMGPCIQAVNLTLINKKQFAIDVFYRTTELFKKFPADLVFLRDVLLQPFDFDGLELLEIRCHFANITIHPMYFVTVIPCISEEELFERLAHVKEKDPYFHDWLVKWSARYVCEEYHRGIAKFSQALRVQKDALSRIEPETLERFQQYCHDNHPGYRNGYVPPDDEEDED